MVRSIPQYVGPAPCSTGDGNRSGKTQAAYGFRWAALNRGWRHFYPAQLARPEIAPRFATLRRQPAFLEKREKWVNVGPAVSNRRALQRFFARTDSVTSKASISRRSRPR